MCYLKDRLQRSNKDGRLRDTFHPFSDKTNALETVRYLPGDAIALGVMLQSNGEISTLVELPKRRGSGWTLFESSGCRRTNHLTGKREAQLVLHILAYHSG